MAITFDWINFCLLCDSPKQSEEGKLPEISYQYCPETLRFRNIRISKIQWHLYTGGTYKPDFTVGLVTGSLSQDSTQHDKEVHPHPLLQCNIFTIRFDEIPIF